MRRDAERISSAGDGGAAAAPDFAREVLDELYRYRRKRPALAWVLWLSLGWAGGHRFYLERYGTALLMMLTGGGIGPGPRWTRHAPVIRSLVRWSHRLRLFYHFNEPGSPPALLMRSVSGAVLAPFRKRARAEVRLYLSLGLAFTLGFLLLDALEALGPLARTGGVPDLAELLSLPFVDAAMTFVVIYAFAAPVGAVLTFHVLSRPSHRVPRLLSALTVAAMATGVLVAR